MKPRTLVVLAKELRDHLRDRRSLTAALIMPLLGPLTLAGMFTAIASWTREDKPLDIPTVGAKNAPNLVRFLERYGARVVPAPADYESKVRDGTLDLALVVPDDFAKEFTGGKSASLRLVVDNSRNKARNSVRRAQRLLQAYTRQIGSLRLLARGVSPEVAQPLMVEELDLATAEKQAANVLGMIPFFLITALFAGCMNIAIDATAGERERGSLEPLLLNPVRTAEIVAGKWLTAVLVSWVATGVTLAGFVAAMNRVPLQDLGVKAKIGAPELLGLLAAALPLAFFAGAAQMLLSVFARSFKEAQTYLSLVLLLPMAPGMVLIMSPFKPALWMTFVPSLGQTVIMDQVMRGEPPGAGTFLLAAAGALVFGGLCLAGTVRLLQSERIVFGR